MEEVEYETPIGAFGDRCGRDGKPGDRWLLTIRIDPRTHCNFGSGSKGS